MASKIEQITNLALLGVVVYLFLQIFPKKRPFRKPPTAKPLPSPEAEKPPTRRINPHIPWTPKWKEWNRQEDKRMMIELQRRIYIKPEPVL